MEKLTSTTEMWGGQSCWGFFLNMQEKVTTFIYITLFSLKKKKSSNIADRCVSERGGKWSQQEEKLPEHTVEFSTFIMVPTDWRFNTAGVFLSVLRRSLLSNKLLSLCKKKCRQYYSFLKKKKKSLLLLCLCFFCLFRCQMHLPM